MILLAAAGICICGTAVCTFSARADDSAVDASLAAVYNLGDLVEIPQRTLTDGGMEYPAEIVVTYPDGRAYRRDTLIADQLGRYTVEYRAAAQDGRLLRELVTFETQDDLYEFSGGKSSASYGLDDSAYATGRTGLKISLAEGETFRYNEVIDLREIGADDTFLELFAMPTQGAGVRDVGTIVVRLEDAHDPENVVTIYGRSVDSDGGADPWWCNATYLSAGAPGQTATGIEWGPPIKIHTSKFGFPIDYSLYGYRNYENSVGKEIFGLKMDLAEKRLYGPTNTGDDYVIDLDERKYFANVWEGFSTGEVYLSVSAENYFSETFAFMVTKIGNSDLGAERLRDTRPPTITVASRGYDLSALPDASVGTPYPVFDASASDVCAAELPVSVKVFCNYASSTRYELPVEDGAFTPDRAGEYTIEYTATDYYGNIGVVLANVHCINTPQPIVIGTDGAPQTGRVGYSVQADAFAVSGGIGRTDISVRVLFDGNEVALSEGKFFPTKAGTYTVECSVTDMAGQTASARYSVEVASNPDPVFLEEPVLPEYLIEGVAYGLPQLRAYCFEDGTWADAELYVTDGAGTNVPAEGAHVFRPDAEGGASLIWRASSENGFAELVRRVSVISAYQGNKIDPAALFVSENAEKQGLYTGIRFTHSAEEMRLTYAIPLNMQYVSAAFTTDARMQSLQMTLTDFADRSRALEIVFESDPKNTAVLRVSADGAETGISVAKGSRIAVTYDNAARTLTVNGIEYMLPAGGFGADGGYLSFRASGEEGAQFMLYSLGEQSFSADMTDESAPVLALEEELGNSYPLHTLLKLPEGRAFDLLTPEATCTVTVLAPDGSYARSGETELRAVAANREYLLSLDLYGTYTVHYDTEDMFGNERRETFTFETTDSVAPVISVMWRNEEHYRAGELVSFGKATATDDCDADCEVEYYVVDPKGSITSIYFLKVSETATSISFVAEESGIYLIRYFASDDAGNVSIHDEEIVVD